MKYTIDAKDKILGRLATQIANILMGKNSASYAPNKVAENEIEVVNTDKMKITGAKMRNKKYYSHSGYIGNLKVVTLGESMEKDSRKVLYRAVWNMMPKNRLRKPRLNNLKLLKGGR